VRACSINSSSVRRCLRRRQRCMGAVAGVGFPAVISILITAMNARRTAPRTITQGVDRFRVDFSSAMPTGDGTSAGVSSGGATEGPAAFIIVRQRSAQRQQAVFVSLDVWGLIKNTVLIPIRHILSEYLERAVAQAEFDKLEDGTFAGRIPACKGVLAFGATLRECAGELRSTLEDGVIVGLKLGHPLPVL